MPEPLVTVIIPAYNCENCISYAIESVLNQTQKSYELIIVDDGSTDNTSKIVLKYKDRIKYIYQDNGGVSKARNKGILNSNGKYIGFLDADDVWENHKLEIQLKAFEIQDDVGLIFSNFRQTKNNLVINGKYYEDAFNIFKEYKYKINNIFDYKVNISSTEGDITYFWGNIYKYLFLGNFILPSSVLFKKSCLEKVGLLNEEYRVAEETEYFLRFSQYFPIGFVNYPLLCYEIPKQDNLSGKKNTQKLIKNALRIQIDSYINRGHRSGNVNSRFYMDGIGMTYCRLAYYYLSEYMIYESRKYAIYGIKISKMNLKLYSIYLLSFLPRLILEYTLRGKHIIMNMKNS
jgi:glycosyltransferase involved in cell wall biosynthesis